VTHYYFGFKVSGHHGSFLVDRTKLAIFVRNIRTFFLRQHQPLPTTAFFKELELPLSAFPILYKSGITRYINPSQKISQSFLLTQKTIQEPRRPSVGGLSDEPSTPLMDALRLSTLESFKALDSTMNGEERGGDSTVLGRISFLPSDNSPQTSLTTTAATGRNKIDHSFPIRPAVKLSYITTMPKKEGAISPSDDDDMDKRAVLIWAYNKQGELLPVLRASDTSNVTKAQILAKIKKV
jgi:hypothetical protein